MNKDQFSNLLDYENALRIQQYEDHAPIDEKIASMCLQDNVVALGNTSATIGECPLAGTCNYRNDKIAGVSGFCLKQTVGTEAI